MSYSLLFCPQCHCLLLQLTRSMLLGDCLTCGWHGCQQFPIILSNVPFTPQKAFIYSEMGYILLASLGQLLRFSPIKNKWQSIPLSDVGSINGLAFAMGTVLLSPSEEDTLGEPKSFIAINPENAQILWQVESEGIQWTVPIADETLACAVDSRGYVAVVHPKTGEPLWNHQISLGNYPYLGISPALSDSYLLLVTPAGELLWLSRRNGKEVGRYLPPVGSLDLSPICVGDIAYLCASAGLYRLDLNTGQGHEIFRAPRQSSEGYFFTSPQITPLGLLILHADFTENGQYSYALQLLDFETGLALWSPRLILSHHPRFAPACEHGRVYLPDRDGHLLILDLATGEMLVSLSLGEEEPASSPVLLDNRLFLLAQSGKLLCFDSDLRLEHLPESIQVYLRRGEWESAALKLALQGELNEAALLYKSHKRYLEARALYELADNSHERDLLNLHSVDFRLSLRPHEDAELKENLYALLEVEIENIGIGKAQDVRLLLASDQMDIAEPKHIFGHLKAGETKTWKSLQIRPHAGGSLLLKMKLSFKDQHRKSHTVKFEQGLTVLQSIQLASRHININIGGDVSDSVIVAGDDNFIAGNDEEKKE